MPCAIDKFKPVVAHSGDGKKHPLHTECVKEALLNNSLCPFCRTPTTFWQDKLITELKLMEKDALFGVVFGILEVLHVGLELSTNHGVYFGCFIPRVAILAILAYVQGRFKEDEVKNYAAVSALVIGAQLGGIIPQASPINEVALAVLLAVAGSAAGALLSGFIQRRIIPLNWQ